jgi:ketosteroid isomerase-like protein
MWITLAVATAYAADDRAEDRAAIRADIDGIYRAFINKDLAKIRATHAENWHGFLEGSREMIRGIDQYMRFVGQPGPYGMSDYKIRDFDIVFAGDAAFVTFITDVEIKVPNGTRHSVQRLADFYVKKDGKWLQTGSNTSISPEAIAEQTQMPQPMSPGSRQSLMKAREDVWRAFFANDREALEKLIPEELVTIEAHGDEFGHRAAVLAAAEETAKSGVKLVALEFPKTEIQMYGNSAVIYSTYRYELEKDGTRRTSSGRVTEVFVLRRGQWVNPGWHMDAR